MKRKSRYIIPTKEEIIVGVEKACGNLLTALRLNWQNDPDMASTPKRMAKMYVEEIMVGCYTDSPRMAFFPNSKGLDEMFIVGPITLRSLCAHHLCPIIGKCYIGVIPQDRILGLSKFTRMVNWLAARPQVQETLVVSIADEFEALLNPIGLAVSIRAMHTCMTWRGVKEDSCSEMRTNVLRGAFRNIPATRQEFLASINGASM